MTKVNCRDCKQSDCAYFGMDNKTNCKDFEAKAPAEQRQWVGLTDEDYVNMGISPSLISWQYKAIEAKLKEKNT